MSKLNGGIQTEREQSTRAVKIAQNVYGNNCGSPGMSLTMARPSGAGTEAKSRSENASAMLINSNTYRGGEGSPSTCSRNAQIEMKREPQPKRQNRTALGFFSGAERLRQQHLQSAQAITKYAALSQMPRRHQRDSSTYKPNAAMLLQSDLQNYQYSSCYFNDSVKTSSLFGKHASLVDRCKRASVYN